VDNAVLLYPVAPPAKVVPAADSSGTAIAQVAIQGSAATKLAKLDPDLTFDPADYQFDMTVTATVLLENGTVAPDGCAIGAFVGNQLRGVGAVEYIPTLEKYLIFLMVHSNEVEGETVVFRAYPEDGASPLLITETIIFGADRVVGQIGLPFTFHTSGVDATALPASFSLGQNYPNPMRPGKGGAISYSLPTRERVLLEVYDLSGRAVSTLVDEEKPAGRHVATIDPQQLPSGLYFYRIAAGSFDSSKRLMVVK
jgi:hypothetical protein